jgi:NTP pyrophosphatase (non-canonical NTP hydrolase)
VGQTGKKVDTQMSIIQKTFESSDKIKNGRTLIRTLAHTMAEVGELAEEIVIANGFSYKQPGEDGIVGEAIDVILCALDIIHKHDPLVTEEDLEKIAIRKLAKWEAKTRST